MQEKTGGEERGERATEEEEEEDAREEESVARQSRASSGGECTRDRIRADCIFNLSRLDRGRCTAPQTVVGASAACQ